MSHAFLSGAAAMGFLVAALFFVRYWQSTRERLFLFFAAAFLVLMCERIASEAMSFTNEWAPFVYLIRLAAFLLLLIGIVDTNRRGKG